MNLDRLVKTALDRMQRPKYHLLKDPSQEEIRAAVLRYARKLARDRGNLQWGDMGHVDGALFAQFFDGCLVRLIEELRAKRALCPRCEGPKQPKYRNHPGGNLQRILACPGCDPTNGAPLTPRPDPEEREDKSIMGFKQA